MHVSPVSMSQPLGSNSHTANVVSYERWELLYNCSAIKGWGQGRHPGDGSRPVLSIQGHCHLPELLSRCGGSTAPQAKIQSQCECVLHSQSGVNTPRILQGLIPHLEEMFIQSILGVCSGKINSRFRASDVPSRCSIILVELVKADSSRRPTAFQGLCKSFPCGFSFYSKSSLKTNA